MTSPARILVCFGTRPEAIKLAPVIARLQEADDLEAIVVSTGQHRSMLDQMLESFSIAPDIDLALMEERQGLADLTARAIAGLGEVMAKTRPQAVLVQGDTTTALCGALAAFYADVPVGHVEAGLRTNDPRSPFPEEINRRLVAPLATWHFCPTSRSAGNLLDEGISSGAIEVTGNTVIDALLAAADRPLAEVERRRVPAKQAGRRRVLVTLHRRETQGAAQRRLCRMLTRLSERPDVEILFPVHLSPAVRESVMPELAGRDHVHLLEPLDYHSFVHVLRTSDLVVTDSGGIQEEAPTFGVPVVVMRDTTERPEGVEAGCVRLSGSSAEAVERDIHQLLDDAAAYARMAQAANPYGDGDAAARIVARLRVDLCVTRVAPALAAA